MLSQEVAVAGVNDERPVSHEAQQEASTIINFQGKNKNLKMKYSDDEVEWNMMKKSLLPNTLPTFQQIFFTCLMMKYDKKLVEHSGRQVVQITNSQHLESEMTITYPSCAKSPKKKILE